MGPLDPSPTLLPVHSGPASIDKLRLTEDVGSYKKIIPALLAFPKTFIVTADDDVFYEREKLGWQNESGGVSSREQDHD